MNWGIESAGGSLEAGQAPVDHLKPLSCSCARQYHAEHGNSLKIFTTLARKAVFPAESKSTKVLSETLPSFLSFRSTA
jgi:hypothetical protein